MKSAKKLPHFRVEYWTAPSHCGEMIVLGLSDWPNPPQMHAWVWNTNRWAGMYLLIATQVKSGIGGLTPPVGYQVLRARRDAIDSAT